MSLPIYDVAIVGGGPAGLTAAMWLARYLHSVVLVDSGDPRNWQTRGVNGYLGLPDITPAALRGAGRKEARRWGAELIDGCVSTVTQESNDHFTITLESGQQLESRRLLLAFGVKDIWPDIPGLEHIYGATAYRCRLRRPRDARQENRGRWRGTQGGGARARAHHVDARARDLHERTRSGSLDELLAQLDNLNIPVLISRVQCAVHEDRMLKSLEMEDGAVLDCERLFFAIGHSPPTTSRNDWGASATTRSASWSTSTSTRAYGTCSRRAI